MPYIVASLTLLAAYLLGAIPFGYWIARMRGVDIFAHGSGNIGATNVARLLGKPLGLLVLVLDAAKGAGPVALALYFKPIFQDPLWSGGYVEVAAGLLAFLGHLFPIYLKFRGGKGVATGLGAVAVLLPMPTLFALGVWLATLLAWRTVSLASIAAVLALCAAQLRRPEAWDWSEPRTWFCLIAGTLVIVKHHANIHRLFQGTENDIRETFVMRQLTKSLHVLALGLWFGASVFFTFVVALSLFHSFEALGQTPAKDRPSWFPQPTMYRDKTDDVNPAKEQGVRAAGFAVGPIFGWYFLLQGACGFIALATALPWQKLAPDCRVHRIRVYLLIAAIACVLIGWPLEQRVSALRNPRNDTTEAYLQDRADTDKHDKMTTARSEFSQWHVVSLLVNFAAILFVTGAMALAGNFDAPPKKDDQAQA